MKRLVFFLISLFGVYVYAQDSRGFVSCTTQTSDMLVQGKEFQVKYVLTATNWKDVNVETSYPFVCKDMQQEIMKSKKGTLNRLVVSAYFICPKTGEVDLPRLSATVGGKTYYSQPQTVYLHPHSRWEEEYSLGAKWLQTHGKDSVLLEPTLRWEELTVFNDKERDAFVVIVSEKYRKYVDNPILAYSTESSFEVNSITKKLIGNMANQLADIGEGKAYYRPLPGTSTAIQPLLGKTAWGQAEPYNTYTPLNSTGHCMTGCVSTALAQVLRYHTPTFSDKTMQPNWADMRDSYSKDESAEAREVAKLMSQIGQGLHTDYGMGTSSFNLKNVKGLLLYQLGCAGKMRHVNNVNDSLMVDLIQAELRQQRPVLASNSSHCYVLDGCDGEYLHYNLGWDGLCNGYYHIPFCATKDHLRMWDLREMMIGIQAASPKKEMTINIKKAGELVNMLTDEEKSTVTHLQIEGKLNSLDMRVLRHMAGAENDDTDWTWEGGSLIQLDLKNANFVTDKTNFFEQTRVFGTSTYTQTVQNEFGTMQAFQRHFDLNNPLSDKMWKEFETYIGTQGDGYTISRDDKQFCWMNERTQKGIISPYMFFRCTSLCHIILPEDVTTIEYGAFAGCSSLRTVHIGGKVKNVDSHAFSFCPVLTTISYTSKITWCGPNFEECPLLVNKPVISSGRRCKFTIHTWD